jgi:hypothetical protein
MAQRNFACKMTSRETLARHDVLVESDNEWQQHARFLQALWRERHDLPVGLHRGRRLGSRLAMPYARDTLATFMTETVRDVVRAEVLDVNTSAGKLYEEPRIYDNLLTSQALCFNLFGELQRNLRLASGALGELLGERTLEVTAIQYEYSPGRSDSRFTADKTAFDVFVVYTSGATRGFLGIEVKYAENLNEDPARHRARYEELAEAMGCFVPERLPELRKKPLEQFWRNHLLAGSLVHDETSGFNEGRFVLLYPNRNVIVGGAGELYRTCLTDEARFTTWTLESVLDAIVDAGGGQWVQSVRERYVG